jgi:transcription elongation factor GreA
MSKAFTKEDDATGVELPAPDGPRARFRLTRAGAKRIAESADARWREALEYAEVLPAQRAPDRAVIGVTVHAKTSEGEERAYRLVSSEERALLGEGCTAESPIGRALLGARVGDVREVKAPRGAEELEITALEGDLDELS